MLNNGLIILLKNILFKLMKKEYEMRRKSNDKQCTNRICIKK